MIRARFTLTLIVALTPPLTSGASFTGLGTLPGVSPHSLAYDVSANGSVVVGRSTDEAFRWTKTSGMVGLGSLSASASSVAKRVSADGSAVVGSSWDFFGTAFRWTQSAGITGLGVLPGGAPHSEAWGVSGNGSVIVGLSDSANGIEAFRWNEIDGLVGLGDIPGGDFSSRAWDVSFDGTTIVGTGSGTSGVEVFRWTEAGGIQPLGTIGDEDFCCDELSMSSDGTTIVGKRDNGLDGWEAFRWTAATGIVSIDGHGDQFGLTTAFGVSGDGSVIVGTGRSSERWEPFIWDETNGTRELDKLLVEDLGLGTELAGWSLNGASAVSDDGLTVVGVGRNPEGTQEGWIANLKPVPVPGSLFFLIPSAAILVRLRRTVTVSQ